MRYTVRKENSAYILNNILWIAPESDNVADSLIAISVEDAERNSEEILQLKEGCSYEYEFLDESLRFELIPGLVRISKKHAYRGRITPGNYVGRLPLKILSDTDSFTIAVEVRSLKSDYRTEYRKMLEDIATHCTDLIMIHSSPVSQRFSVDYGNDSESLYQRFAFVQAMLDSDDFHNAVYRIIISPITRWKAECEKIDSRRVKRIIPSHISQIASGNNRIPIQNKQILSGYLSSIPRMLTSYIKSDTLDNPENRFIKHALSEFTRFAGFICQKIDDSNKSNKPNIYYEAKKLEERLSEYLSHNMFRGVSQLDTLPLNSPVLQRKEGYREVFHVWLMYDLAAKLTWDGLDNDTYHTGKRDAAALYEYWLFFKLLNMIEEMFQISPLETKQLIQETEDGLGLQLKAGHHIAIKGRCLYKKRNLIVKFSYNRTFKYAEYPESGTWTQTMRPDYTFSFWPMDFSEVEAEKQELVVHIHFDAKYKVQDLEYLINYNRNDKNDNDIEDINYEKELEKTGKYKRADLLKMHAYKDAIRRTAGAYVLYPGSKSLLQKGFHELIPGLGAFAVTPSNNADGIENVKQFVLNVLDHYTSRTNQREMHNFYTYKIMKDSPDNPFHESIPEYKINISGEKQRIKPLNTTNVLIAYIQKKQKKWVLKNHIYNIRFDNAITPQIAGADYLLLYDNIIDKKLTFWKNGLFCIKNSPVLKSRDWLLRKNYPSPGMLEYFIYEISQDIEEWSIGRISEICLIGRKNKFRPFIKTLPEIMR